MTRDDSAPAKMLSRGESNDVPGVLVVPLFLLLLAVAVLQWPARCAALRRPGAGSGAVQPVGKVGRLASSKSMTASPSGGRGKASASGTARVVEPGSVSGQRQRPRQGPVQLVPVESG